MSMIKINLEVLIDATDLLAEVGDSRSKRLLENALYDELPNVYDHLLQSIGHINVNGKEIPVAVRKIMISENVFNYIV